MKQIIGCIAITAIFAFTGFNGVFDLSVTTTDGNDLPLSQYQGRKMMVLVLPVTQTGADSALLQLLDTLSIRYADSITMVGVPSYEDGFADDSLESLLPWWRSLLGEQFLITGGMSTRKLSAYQTPLFSYLTHADQNSYFDGDVAGAGEKFFIDQDGDLCGISTPDAAFDEDIFKAMLSRTNP
jgi:glutathione peroxidase-family protein